MNNRILSFLLSVFFIGSVFGGQGTGNGGDVIVCETSDGTNSYELLDLYETRETHLLEIDINSNSNSFLDSALYQLDKIKTWEGETFFREKMSSFMNRVSFVKKDLVDIPDSNHVYIPSNCHLRQIAINYDGLKVEIDKRLWDKLDNHNKSALILHELFYEQMVAVGHQNSLEARLLNSYLHGNSNYLFGHDGEAYSNVLNEFFELERYRVSTKKAIKIFEGNHLERVKHQALEVILSQKGRNRNEARGIEYILDLLQNISVEESTLDRVYGYLDVHVDRLYDYFLTEENVDRFGQILTVNLKHIDFNERRNKTSRSLRLLKKLLKNAPYIEEEEKFIPILVLALKRVKREYRLSRKLKRILIDDVYSNLNLFSFLHDFSKEIVPYANNTLRVEKDSAADFDFLVRLMARSSWIIKYDLKVVGKFIDYLESGYSEVTKINLMRVYIEHFQNEKVIQVLKNGLNGSSSLISSSVALKVLKEKSLYRHFFMKNLRDEVAEVVLGNLGRYWVDHLFHELYDDVSIPLEIKKKMIDLIKKRELSAADIKKRIKMLNTSLNQDEDTINLVGFLIHYKYYELPTKFLFGIVEGYKNELPIYLSKVIFSKLKSNFGNDLVLGYVLYHLREKKLSVEILDVVKRISETSTNEFIVERANVTLRYNGVLSFYDKLEKYIVKGFVFFKSYKDQAFNLYKEKYKIDKSTLYSEMPML